MSLKSDTDEFSEGGGPGSATKCLIAVGSQFAPNIRSSLAQSGLGASSC